ncbi:MAG TPA: extracellular solute-binding protein [Candidatus Omnitrophota bacterium]|nr:extracellular solute-binding protein [Candidatus Omnitrophota bacterium]
MKRVLIIIIGLAVLIGLIRFTLTTGSTKHQQESNTITLWHWMTDRQEVFEELALKYEEQTGIKVKVDLYAPSDAYTQRIVASAQARVLPDIYGILDKKEIFASFIENGFVADLTAEFQANNAEWELSLYEKAVDVNRFKDGNIHGIKPGIYGVPIDVTNIQMVYNKKLLEKAGISKAPKTFDEFLQAIVALKRVGIAGLVSGWGELWMADCFASNYAFNIMGEEKIMATYRGEVPYTDPDWIAVFGVFETLRKSGAFFEGIVTKPNKDAEQDFALERAAFSFNGSWCVNVYHGMNPNLDYGVMLPPAVSIERPMRIWGGAGSSFVVNNSTPKKDKAIAFLKWLTAPEQQAFLAERTKNLPANRKALSSIPEILADFAKGSEFTTHPTIWPYNEHPLVTEAFTKGLQSIIIGEKTPQEVAKEVQAMKEREMKKAAQR